ncbi:MAG: hypothetical protein ACYCXW_16890 [Solirubrobacteraceae bacterium]
MKRREGIEKRVHVRRPDDFWSDEFRQEMRRDRRFEASLMLRQAIVLLIVVAIIALRLLTT